MDWRNTDGGAAFKMGHAGNSAGIVAGGNGDGTEKESAAGIDRLGFGCGKIYIQYTTTLASTKTLSLEMTMTHSDDDSTYSADVVLLPITVMATGALTAKTEIYTLDIDFTPYKRYVKLQVKPTMSATGTDTAEIMFGIVLAGAEVLPAA